MYISETNYSIERTEAQKVPNKIINIISTVEYLKNKENFISESKRCLLNQIFVLQKGDAVFWIDVNDHDISDETILFYAEGQLQLIEEINNLTGFVILFTNDLFIENSTNGSLENNEIINYLTLSVPTKPTKEQFADILNVIKYLKIEVSKGENKIQHSITQNLFKIFLYKIYQSFQQEKVIKTNNNFEYDVIYKFTKLLDENIQEKKNVDFYSSQLFITSRKLNEVLKRCLNKNAKQMIDEKIIIEAKRELVNSGLTIKEIGHAMGFSDPTNFNKFFKRVTNKTPAEYREELSKSFTI